jgi:hypothetical protein
VQRKAAAPATGDESDAKPGGEADAVESAEVVG